MSEQYMIAGAARQELDELQADLFRRVRFHILTAAQASAMYWKRLREIISEARRPIPEDATVIVQCRFCSNRYPVTLEVREFTCTCSREQKQDAIMRRIGVAGERLFEQKRVALTPEGRLL